MLLRARSHPRTEHWARGVSGGSGDEFMSALTKSTKGTSEANRARLNMRWERIGKIYVDFLGTMNQFVTIIWSQGASGAETRGTSKLDQ